MTADWIRPIVHFEILARDPEVQRRFYGELFNWPFGEGPIMNVPSGLGGPEPGPAGHMRQSDRTGFALVHPGPRSRRVAAAGARSRRHRGVRALRVPGGPTIAAIDDPEGNPLVLVQQ